MGCCTEREDDSPCYECLLKSVQRVRKLHKEVDGNTSICGDPDCCGEYDEGYMICSNCWEDYPCTTIKTLDGEQ